jgi:hypothetical protein
MWTQPGSSSDEEASDQGSAELPTTSVCCRRALGGRPGSSGAGVYGGRARPNLGHRYHLQCAQGLAASEKMLLRHEHDRNASGLAMEEVKPGGHFLLRESVSRSGGDLLHIDRVT